MSQLYNVNGQWMTIDQVKKFREKEAEKLEEKEEVVEEVKEEVVSPVEEPKEVKEELPEVKENVIVKKRGRPSKKVK